MTTKLDLNEMGVWLRIRTKNKKEVNQYLELIDSIVEDINKKVCGFAIYDGRCTGLTNEEFDREDFFDIRDEDFLKFIKYLKNEIPRGTCNDKISTHFMTHPKKKIRKKTKTYSKINN